MVYQTTFRQPLYLISHCSKHHGNIRNNDNAIIKNNDYHVFMYIKHIMFNFTNYAVNHTQSLCAFTVQEILHNYP